jgi:translocation and assembly module TamB
LLTVFAAQVVGLLQLEEAVSLDGRLDVDFRVHGTAEMPLIVGTMDATDVHYQGYSMQRVAGDVQYGERRLGLNLAAWQNDLRVLRMSGQIPALLSLNGAAVSFPDEQIDLIVEADSLPAAFVAGVFRDMVDVQGTVAGRFLIGGTLDNPAPTGSLDLQNAAWTLESVGVRHENVRGTLTLRPDGTVEVDATANADGTARMTGSVKLAPLRNPTFDLQVSFDNFRAVDRRDAVANVGGIIRLTGTFRAPLIEGLGPAEGLRVESGILYLEEVVRSATIVDLTDPRFREYVDSTLTQTRDVIAESQNPFLQNLRVEVDVAVAQDTWLRSSEMDVEIGGDLRVSYDRRTFNLQLAGVLDARRGQYTVLGRTFQVQEGTVEFRGGAGINPILNILAATRVRRQNTDQLTITARVTGTLTEPRVALGSEEAAIGESDLVSYLLFGQPSYELASTQRAQVGAATSFVGTFAVGTVASRLGSVIARFGGLDYFAITEVGSAWDLGSVTQSQLEFGQYLRQDLFLVLGFQPAQVSGSSLKDAVGVRVEYTPTQRYTLETFYEDRFSRSRVLGFQDVGLVRQKILGLSLFREWGF